MRRADLIALLLSLSAILASYLTADLVFENMPHIEDEMAYVWQAEAAAHGYLTLPSPPSPKAFLVPFVVDYHGQRFGKYPPGWPAMLALGVWLGLRTWVNPLLAGACVWLTYRLGKKLFSELVGLLAAGLTLSSPFFLMNSGSLLSHPFGLFLSAAFALAWLDAWDGALLRAGPQGSLLKTVGTWHYVGPQGRFAGRPRSQDVEHAVPPSRWRRWWGAVASVLQRGMEAMRGFWQEEDQAPIKSPEEGEAGRTSQDIAYSLSKDKEETTQVASPRAALNPWLPTLVAACSLGMLVITRPLTAVGVCLPFVFHGAYLLLRGDAQVRKRLLTFAGVVLLFTLGLFVWQFAVTGDPTLNPYTLWWDYDKIGFGPGFGHTATGHTWQLARINTRFSLFVGWRDLFGWASYSWIFLPIGVFALLARRSWKALMPLAVFPALVFIYLFYWIVSYLFGPLYFFEGLYSLTILSAAGIAWLAGWPLRDGAGWRPFRGWRRARPLLLAACLALLLYTDLIFYLPVRMHSMYGLYGITRSRLLPFQTAQAQEVTPALVIVHPGKWTEYGALLDLETPFLDTPFIFVINVGEKTNAALAEEFPQRTLIHYYPKQPYVFYRVEADTSGSP
jgi:hypothetical protein